MSQAVEAPDLSGLIELSRNPRLDMKPVLLRVQSDLFLAAPIRDRAVRESFAALAGGLIPTVDRETLLLVARKLAPCPDTPHNVLRALVERDAAAAETVLSHVPAPDADLIDAARVAGADVEAALAQRGPAIRRTIDEEDGEADGGAGDLGAVPTSLAETILAARADRDAARRLLERADLAPADLAPLWLHADAARRGAIRDALEAVAALRPCPPAPRRICDALSASAKSRDVAGVIGALADGLGLPAGFVGGAPDAAARYDLLTLALRAVDLAEVDAIYLFLTLNETVGRSVTRVFELVELFRDTSRPVARALLASILDTELSERGGTGEHRSYLARDPTFQRAQAVERPKARASRPQRNRTSA